MLYGKNDSNADLITEIKAGIKKEVSTGCRPKKVICNICGTDNTKSYCPHYPGREYDKDTGKVTCLMTLDGAKEAYELSLVAVPAQKRAGTTKHYTVENDIENVENHTKCTKNDEKELENIKNDEKDNLNTGNKDVEIDLKIKLATSFIYTENNKLDN